MNPFDLFSTRSWSQRLGASYQRQRQMTLGDLLLENRIDFSAGRNLRRQCQ